MSMSHLKMKTIDDAIGVVAEIQIRHNVKEINDDYAKVQLYAAKLFVAMQREKRLIEEEMQNRSMVGDAPQGKGMVRKIS